MSYHDSNRMGFVVFHHNIAWSAILFTDDFANAHQTRWRINMDVYEIFMAAKRVTAASIDDVVACWCRYREKAWMGNRWSVLCGCLLSMADQGSTKTGYWPGLSACRLRSQTFGYASHM